MMYKTSYFVKAQVKADSIISKYKIKFRNAIDSNIVIRDAINWVRGMAVGITLDY